MAATRPLSEIEHSRQLRRAVIASTVGTTIESYDFLLYGILTGIVFGKLFFPKSDPLVGVLEAFAIYAVGFIARPIGAAIFGHYGDRVGRKATLIATLLITGLATFAIGCVPTYESIGPWAAVILTVIRFIQGLGVGGEWSGSVLLAMEWARTNQHRGFIASWPQFGAPAGLCLANGAVLVFSTISGDQFVVWGWRIPFLLSIVMVAVGLYIRLGILETPAFRRLVDEKRIERVPVIEVIKRQPRAIILSALARMGQNAPAYIYLVFVFAYGIQVLHASRDFLLMSLICGSVLSFVTIPLSGHLSDRFGRKRIYLLGAVLTGIFAFVYFALLNTAVPIWIFLAIVLSFIPHDLMWGTQGALIAECFPPRLRYSGSSLGVQLASIIAGGPAPLIATALLAAYGSGYAIAGYMALCAIVSIVSTAMMPDYTNKDISEEHHSHIAEPQAAANRTTSIDTPVEHLDLATVIKLSHALSAEIVLEKLLDTLMRTAIEQAGATRGLLILTRGAEHRIAAEATTSGDTVSVHGRDDAVAETVLPASVLNYVLRTRESVVLDDAAVENRFPEDTYISRNRSRSILCLPLLHQAKFVGVLYLENTLAPRVFVSGRIAILKLLASQAAISIENTRLYRNLEDREAKIRRLVDANIIGIVVGESDSEGRLVEANDAYLRIMGYDREDLISGRLRRSELTPPEWRERNERALAELRSTGSFQPFEKEYFRKDGSRVPVLIGGARFKEGGNEADVAFVLDLTERKRAEDALRNLESELAHTNRVSMMGELAAELSHEITQPIASARNNARAAQNFLDKQPPDLGEVREALSCVVDDTDRAGDIIDRIRHHMKNAPPRKAQFDLNEAINEIIVLGRSAIIKSGVSVQTRLSQRLSPVHGDRVQLQQVVLNLILNAVEAMDSVEAKPRDLLLSTEQDHTRVLVAVRDSGPGIDPSHLERVFDAFHTTKSSGMGMGLSICRSIISAHGGRLWAEANEPRGAVFQFTLPTVP
jgi:PAS domain S-box-containing protein